MSPPPGPWDAASWGHVGGSAALSWWSKSPPTTTPGGDPATWQGLRWRRSVQLGPGAHRAVVCRRGLVSSSPRSARPLLTPVRRLCARAGRCAGLTSPTPTTRSGRLCRCSMIANTQTKKTNMHSWETKQTKSEAKRVGRRANGAAGASLRSHGAGGARRAGCCRTAGCCRSAVGAQALGRRVAASAGQTNKNVPVQKWKQTNEQRYKNIQARK